jgi:hypothetical protein
VQPEASKYARSQELRHGTRGEYPDLLSNVVSTNAIFSKATSKDGKDQGIELIQPPANSKPGERVYFEGANYESMVN